VIEDITDGYHKWRGAKPILRDSLSVRIVIEIIIWGKLNIIVVLDINKSLEPNAWIKKYFTVASVSWNWEDAIISGIKHKRFNSIAIHMNNQLVLDTASNVLIIRSM
jgi:hypothetical protein